MRQIPVAGELPMLATHRSGHAWLAMLNVGACTWKHSVSHGPSVRDTHLRVISAQSASPFLHAGG